jgi:SAM-dependent methyltransferase
MTNRDLWNARYAEKGSAWGREPNQFVAARLGGLSPCRVLDLGSGQGRNALWLAAAGHRVTAIDVSDVATAQARAEAEARGLDVEFLAADLETWQPEPGEYDLVLLSYIQVPVTTRRIVHAKADRALRPGGRLFIVAHHRDNLEHGIGGPQHPDRLYTEYELESDFPGYRVEQSGPVIRHVARPGEEGDAIDVIFDAFKPAA